MKKRRRYDIFTVLHWTLVHFVPFEDFVTYCTCRQSGIYIWISKQRSYFLCALEMLHFFYTGLK